MERKINPRLNILGKYKTMNIINPFIFAPVVKSAEAFIAPANFNPNDQEVNIIGVFNTFKSSIPNAKYIYSVTPLDTVLIVTPVVVGRTYYYSENGDSVKLASRNINFLNGSTQRYVIVVDDSQSIQAILPDGSCWLYFSRGVNQINSSGLGVDTLKYIHGETIESLVKVNFSGCSNLIGNLTLPTTTNILDFAAFYKCSNLSGNLIIPSIYELKAGYEFVNCSGFTGTLTIPSSVTSLGGANFSGCSGFTGLVIPNSVTIIGSSAFAGCSGFTGTLILPSMTTIIGSSAFADCSGFTGTLMIPSVVTTIGDGAFSGCSGFTGTLILPNSVITIGNGAFMNCRKISNIVISESITNIVTSAFGMQEYGALISGDLIIPNGVTTIGAYAFARGYFNGKLSLPASITQLDTEPWYGCTFFTILDIAPGYSYSNLNFSFSQNFTSLSLNSSIINLTNGTKTMTIGSINKARLLNDYPTAESNANARGITIE
jgi:hypothetical protein